MRWLVDTSAWSRRDLPEVQEQLAALVADGGELVLSPAVLLELLRGPQHEEVAKERATLTTAMKTIPTDERTFELAADAMEQLALHEAEAHRLPVADLVTAALAHQHDCGVLHCDGDYEEIAEYGGLAFERHQITVLPAKAGTPAVAGKQRALKKELAQLMHQMEVADAEEFLGRVVEQARDAVS